MNSFCECAAISLVSLSLLASCDDPKAANAGNFEKAIQRYYDMHPVCVSIPVELPLESSVDIDDTTRHQLDALVKLGFVAATAPAAAGATPSRLGGAHDAAYAATAAGENVVKKGENSFIGDTDICFAHRRIEKIDSFSQPADLMGMKVSHVTYDYGLKDVEPWARDGAIQDVFPRIKTQVTTPHGTGEDGIVLTNEGWQYGRELR